MSYLDAFILGVLQGLTEFLPVSSSGHLVIAQQLLGVTDGGVAFEVIVHFGTLLAVLIYFRSRIWSMIRSVFDTTMKNDRALVGYILLGTIPAAVAGLLLKDFFEEAFGSPVLTSVMLLVTGALLLSSVWARKRANPVKMPSALIMGLAQAMAIMPGISRSGSTIVAGLHAGVEPSAAAEFSFLLAIPAIAGAVVLNIGDLVQLDSALAGQYAAGMVASFLLSLVAVYTVLVVIRKGKFAYFAYYCFAAGALGLYLFL